MVQTLPTDRSDQPLGESILPGTSRCRQHLLDAHAVYSLTELVSIDPIAVAQQITWRCVLRKGLDHLLACPERRGIGGHVEMHHTPTLVGQDYIREMLARRLVRRVLIAPPAGLVGNWRREMRQLFSLPFEIAPGGDARRANPFAGEASDLLIVSIDTLAGERMFSCLQEATVRPYDLVIFDEAHKLSAHRDPDLYVRKTDRYRVAEALAGIDTGGDRWTLDWAANQLLLLTATPHMGKEYPYFALWRLLEPHILPTPDAFAAYPAQARKRHFIRRIKEEMVSFDGKPLYPRRESSTHSYELTQGDVSEQRLYDETTDYIEHYYNRARILNRSAARLAMSVFQRRLASSTWALLRSFERRLERLEELIAGIESGQIDEAELQRLQLRFDRARVHDVFEEKTADEEGAEGDEEENEVEERKVIRAGIIATSLGELIAERDRVRGLVSLAEQVYERGQESKFEKLRELLSDPNHRDEKVLVFTEHRDTLTFLVRRLEGLGFTGKVAQIHGGMSYQQRDEQVQHFRKPADEGGATYMVATDAAGEGINLQFCWLMVNYDIPWNPARLEQRMGRIHRYKQKHDPVLILNLVAGKTREGRVLRTLLDKLERIRKELDSDKVFDVVGRLFEGRSLKEYLESALTEAGAEQACRDLEGSLTKEQIAAYEAREQLIYGDGGDVRRELERLRRDVDHELYRRLLPGYVRQFIERSVPLVGVRVEGNLDRHFSLEPIRTGTFEALWPVLESYPRELHDRLTVYRPANDQEAIWLHPGEPLFERFRATVLNRLEAAAKRGAVFVDAATREPYLFHLCEVAVIRRADPEFRAFQNEEMLEVRLIGLRQYQGGAIEPCPAEHLLVLKGTEASPARFGALTADGENRLDQARAWALERIGRARAEEIRASLACNLDERLSFLARGYDYQQAELAERRNRLAQKARAGDPAAKAEWTRVKVRQRILQTRREAAIRELKREPGLISVGEVRFLAYALVVPSVDPEDRKRQDAEVERIAVQVAWAYEESHGARVFDVSKAALALEAGLQEYPGFDLLSKRPNGEVRSIEVKGRARIGDVELTENEWPKACNLRDRYWLYVVFECTTSHPRLLRVQDPFGKLVVRRKGGVVIDEKEIFAAAEA